MAEENVTLQVFELGNATMVAAGSNKVISEIAIQEMQNQADELMETISYIKDLFVIKEFEVMEGPQVDILHRFTTVGYRGLFASDGYFKLQKYFRCKEHHAPDRITAGYMWSLLKRWIRQLEAERKYGNG